MSHDDEVDPRPMLLRQALLETQRKNIGAIVGSDANSRHEIWGSTDTNQRGESLFEFIVDLDLCICNRGKSPTFVTAGREEVLDLTLVSNSIAPLISDWKVLEDHSFSDHRCIGFSLDEIRPPTNIIGTLGKQTGTCTPKGSVLLSEIHRRRNPCVDIFSSGGNYALESSCPLTKPKGRGRRIWWTLELSEIRASVRRPFKKLVEAGQLMTGRCTGWGSPCTSPR
ncbi:uncharacterized protein LOC128919970 [Zeugodacus cucurbitae]|uniref:uncharacterized protein LOC128919970 n=1 Tax=Zeugodacus cucurbitae TaxID=28588 RepID=UPI0023D8EB45|nr:uncharacterized protein LOC128919970 [Zeugodacus cucurbitae]